MTKSVLLCDSNTEPIKTTANWGLRFPQKILGLSSSGFCLVNDRTGDSKCSLETEQIFKHYEAILKNTSYTLYPQHKAKLQTRQGGPGLNIGLVTREQSPEQGPRS